MSQASLKSLFEEQVARCEHDLAATCAGEAVTFGELNARANRVARRLRAAGIGRDDLVGICAPRSIEMLAAVLGVIKAGGAYLPLDPTYPRERLAYMVADSRVGVVLWASRDGRCPESLPADGSARLVDLDERRGDLCSESSADLDLASAADALAYVIYTSGSTGKPKGVLGTESGMLHRLSWMWHTFPFRTDEVGCVKTSLSFLDSFCEIFGPLLQGRPVVVVEDEAVKDARMLVGVLEAGLVTRLVVVPALLRALLANVPDLGTRLRRVGLWVTSGEALDGGLARRFREVLPEARLLNLYGSSEVSADCTWYDVSAGPPEAVAIGRPLADNTVYLLDDELRAVPAGAAGGLYVGGPCVARGYLGRPDLTAERFLPDPFGPRGSRMFRSGDIARARADGLFEYLGRSDQQVKVRGFRVELGEIEVALKRHPAVAQAAVIAREERAGHKQLIAYVAPAPGGRVDGPALREHLARELPDYMVPAAVLPLAALPLTPSGKLDRTALGAPAFAARGDAPRTPAEAALARLFAEVLELDHVGIDDRFFDLGGDSLSAMTLVSEASAAGFEFSSVDVFRHQSVRELAALGERASSVATGTQAETASSVAPERRV